MSKHVNLRSPRLIFQRGALALLLSLLVNAASTEAALIIETNASWKYLKGLSEASSPDTTAWRAANFDDAQWAIGAGPFYYENQPGSETAYQGNTLLADMQGGYTSLFLRRTFAVPNPAAISDLTLQALCDDGFIAWINGTEVARFNMPAGDPAFNGLSSPALAEPVPLQTYTLSNPGAFLVGGTNVLAIQAFNCALSSSSDFLINVALSSSVDTIPPKAEKLVPEANAIVTSLKEIEVIFSENVTGVDAADLLINGKPSTAVTQVSGDDYLFEFPQPATGKVQVAWSPGPGIQDLAPTPNAFAGGSWIYDLDPHAVPPGVLISEFMADNKKTLRDEDGDHSDWIELLNAGTSTVNLKGWFLTDTTSNLTRWRFPNVSLSAKAYLVLFASGKNRTNASATLHTDFKLDKDGGYLALLDPNTNMVSEFAAYPAQSADVSYGRDRVNPNLLVYFPTSTPRAPNSVGGPGFAPKVKFSRQGGTFTSPFALNLTTEATNAVIRYTRDGSIPSDNSTQYTDPIDVTGTTQIEARAFVAGLLPGPPRVETYLALDASLLNFSSDLPLVVIHNFGAGSVPSGTRQPANIAVFDAGTGRSTLTNQPQLSARAGINIRGSSTMYQAKKNFRVEFWDEYNTDQSQPFLGLPDDSDWVLYACNNFEPVLIHNPFAHELSRRIGRYSSRFRFVEVYVNTTGGPVSQANYNGVYVLLEKIKIGKHRVDIDSLEPEQNTPPLVTGGYLMSIDRPSPGEGQIYTAGVGVNCLDPKYDELSGAQFQYLNNYFNSMEDALNSPSFADPAAGYAQYIDLGAAIDHHIVNVLTFNVDALRLSGFFYKPRQGKLCFGPLWDFDRALGSTDGRDANPRIWRSASPDYGTDMFNADPIFANPWYSRMFRDLNFWQKWIDRWQELRRDPFALTNLYALVDTLTGQVREAEQREVVRWPGFTTPRRGSYQVEVDYLKTWLSNRVDFIDTNFLAAPVLSNPGGPVAIGTSLGMSAPAGASIYYTLDGTDPRAFGGSIASNARIYTASITLTNNARIVARARDLNHQNLTGANKPPLSSPWSGPSAATFIVQSPSVAITELMYNPLSIGTNTKAFGEYVELLNLTDQPVPLFDPQAPANTWLLRGGIDFTLPTSLTLAPGGALLLVTFDPTNLLLQAAFRSAYGVPADVVLAGPYSGKLDNGGDRIGLYRPSPAQSPTDPQPGLVSYLLVDEVRYSDQLPWPVEADGTGKSLQRIAAEQYGSDPANWQAAAPTPGLVTINLTDRDGDGLPDAWETANGLNPSDPTGVNGGAGDADADGFTNMQEYLAGTDPRDAASFLKLNSLETVAGIVKLRFTAVQGRSYTVLYQDSLPTGPWSILKQLPNQAATAEIEVLDSTLGRASRYYRLATP
jgi:hypothetical protein